jgi:hypothetical protein
MEGGSKPLTRVECLVAMTMILKGFSEAKDKLLAKRQRISNAKATSVEFSNIKQVVEMGVISQEEGKALCLAIQECVYQHDRT